MLLNCWYIIDKILKLCIYNLTLKKSLFLRKRLQNQFNIILKKVILRPNPLLHAKNASLKNADLCRLKLTDFIHHV